MPLRPTTRRQGRMTDVHHLDESNAEIINGFPETPIKAKCAGSEPSMPFFAAPIPRNPGFHYGRFA